MATIAEIQSWLSANPGASDATIAAAMDKYGVSTQQMAQASNTPMSIVQSRYNAVKPAQQTNMLYNQLTPQSSHQQIIDAYNQWVATQGGSSAKTLQQADEYLKNLGISKNVINQSEQRYVNAPNLGSLAGGSAQQVQAGDNAGAYAAYQQAVNQYGFTPEEFSQALGGQFSPQQIQQWAAQGAQGVFSQPTQQASNIPSFNYGDPYWNQVGSAYQGMFGGQAGLHVPELKEWYAGQGWNPGKAVTMMSTPVSATSQNVTNYKDSY